MDSEGRQRFHGAFTGGWSAGYYNTAGSAEGWAPSTFKSSRADRGAVKCEMSKRARRCVDLGQEAEHQVSYLLFVVCAEGKSMSGCKRS